MASTNQAELTASRVRGMASKFESGVQHSIERPVRVDPSMLAARPPVKQVADMVLTAAMAAEKTSSSQRSLDPVLSLPSRKPVRETADAVQLIAQQQDAGVLEERRPDLTTIFSREQPVKVAAANHDEQAAVYAAAAEAEAAARAFLAQGNGKGSWKYKNAHTTSPPASIRSVDSGYAPSPLQSNGNSRAEPPTLELLAEERIDEALAALSEAKASLGVTEPKDIEVAPSSPMVYESGSTPTSTRFRSMPNVKADIASPTSPAGPNIARLAPPPTDIRRWSDADAPLKPAPRFDGDPSSFILNVVAASVKKSSNHEEEIDDDNLFAEDDDILDLSSSSIRGGNVSAYSRRKGAPMTAGEHDAFVIEEMDVLAAIQRAEEALVHEKQRIEAQRARDTRAQKYPRGEVIII